jgi:hypothetical protein
MSKILSASVACAVFLVSSQAFAVNWGGVQDDGCNGNGKRQFSSVLWNIPVGASWEKACAATSIYDWGTPSRCVNDSGVKMWGQWDRPDPQCF